jgi:hypothetical protein
VVGYIESQISRLEQDQRLAALFVPTLAERLLALVASRDTTAGPPGVPEPPHTRCSVPGFWPSCATGLPPNAGWRSAGCPGWARPR